MLHAVPRSPMLRRGGMLAAALLSLAALPATAHADAWLRGPLLAGGTVNPSAGVALGSDRAGVTTAAWQGVGSGSSGVVAAARIAPDGTASPVRALGPASNGTAPPSIAVAPGGATAVAWSDDQASTPDKVMLVALAADGTPGPARTVATIASVDAATVTVGVSDAGDAVVAWLGQDGGAQQLYARRVAADGTLGTVVTVPVPDTAATLPHVAVAPAGDAWLTWTDDASSTTSAWVARLTPAGALDGAPLRLTGPATSSETADLAASDGGAVVVWDEGGTILRAARLAKSGALLGSTVTVSAAMAEMAPPDVAVAPDGVATIGWTEAVGVPGPTMTVSTQLRRFHPDGTLATPTAITPAAGSMAVFPNLVAAPDGTLTTTWFEGGPTEESLFFNARQTRADGTATTPTRQISGDLLILMMISGPMGADVFGLASSGSGHAVVAWPAFTGSAASVATRIFDGVAPTAEASVPATVTLGTDATFTSTAADAFGIAGTWWEFGDDSGSRRASTRHRYADPGTYPVTLTVTDKAGNETTVTRQVTVVAPAPRATRAPAALKLTKVARKGAKVTVAGTLAKSAGGKVTIAYAQKIGRRSLSKRITAKIAKGKFSATFALRGKLAQARGGKATVTVSYAGDADTNLASAKRTVANPKQAKRAKRR